VKVPLSPARKEKMKQGKRPGPEPGERRRERAARTRRQPGDRARRAGAAPGGISRFVVMVSDAPFASLKPYTALRYARSARRRNLETRIVFFADGVLCVRKGVGRGSRTVGDFEARVLEVIREGVRVEVCAAPMRLYSLTGKDLIPGVTIARDVISYALDEQTRVIWL